MLVKVHCKLGQCGPIVHFVPAILLLGNEAPDADAVAITSEAERVH